MSDDKYFNTCLIKDNRIGELESLETYAIQQGGALVSQQSYPFSAASASNMSFVINVPSQSVVVDRHAVLSGTVGFQITINADITVPAQDATGGAPAIASQNIKIPPDTQVFNLGLTDAPAAFPFNSLFTTNSLSVNNASFSSNLIDIYPAVLNLINKESVLSYNSGCPSLPDQFYGQYCDGIGANNNVLGSYSNNSYDNELLSRGGFGGCQVVSVAHTWTSTTAGVATNGSNTLLVSLAAPATGTTISNEKWVINLNLTSNEPFLGLSPFNYNNSPYNAQGLLGITTLSVVNTLDSTCSRFWSSANNIWVLKNNTTNAYIFSAVKTVTGYTTLYPINQNYINSIKLQSSTQGVTQPWSNLQMQMTYLTPQSYEKISAKNSVAIMSFPRYITPSSSSLLGWDRSSPTTLNFTRITSQNIQISNVPDYFCIYARIPLSQQNSATTNSFCVINGVSITFNNKAGILSNAKQNALFQICKKNGSSQNYTQFQGYALQNTNATPSVSNGGQGLYVPTSGSLLLLSPSYDFGLPGTICSGSQGSYNFSVELSVANQLGFTFTPEIVIMTMNSGILTTVSGVSQINSGILTEAMIAHAIDSDNSQPAVFQSEYERLVGSGHSIEGKIMIHGLKRHLGKMKKIKPIVHEMVGAGEGFGHKKLGNKLHSLIR